MNITLSKNKIVGLFVLIALLLPTVISAQETSIFPNPKEVVDVVAQAEYGMVSKYDNKRCAIIKINTSIPQGDLQFVTDLASSIEKIISPYIGQVWVFVTAGAKQLTVHHLKFHHTAVIPSGAKVSGVYETSINYDADEQENEEDGDGGHYFVLRTDPQEVEVVMDDTLTLSTSTGYINQFLTNGTHSYSVSSRLYTSTGGVVYMKDEKVEQQVTLRPEFGYIFLAATPTASVYIDDMEVGKTPFTTAKLPFGDHSVRLSVAGYEPFDTTITLSSPADTVAINHRLMSLYSTVSLEAMQGAAILVNGEQKGIGSWRGDLLQGEYLVSTTLDGHKESKQRIVVEKNTPLSLTLEHPTPIYGRLNVNATQPDVEVALDGKTLGTAPNIFSDILVGSHTVTYSGKGLKSKSERITIEEGKTAQTVVTLTAAEQSDSDSFVADLYRNMVTLTATDHPNPFISDTPKKTTPTKTTPTRKPTVEGRTLLLAQMGYHPSLLSYGLMVGWVRTNGFYLKATSDFNSLESTELTTNDQCELSNGTMGYFYNEARTAHTAITAGYVRRLSSWLYLYAGAGYGSLAYQWYTDGERVDYYWITNTDHTFKGLAADAGAIVRMGAFSLSVGGSTTCFKFNELNIGLGVAF